MKIVKHNHSLVALIGLTFFAIPHLIDDFLYNVPAELGLDVQFTQFLAGVFAVYLALTIVFVTRRMRLGYFLALFMGGFLALAVIVGHVPRIARPGPYWSGTFSEVLIYGVGFCGGWLAVTAARALLHPN